MYARIVTITAKPIQLFPIPVPLLCELVFEHQDAVCSWMFGAVISQYIQMLNWIIQPQKVTTEVIKVEIGELDPR